jgi:hypothetical protein
MTKKPEEKQLETLLENLKPEPSERFYQKMENAPWQQNETEEKPKLIRFPYARAAAIVIISLCLLLMTQPAQSFAQWLASLFQIVPSETTTSISLPIVPTSTYVPSPSPSPALETLQANLAFTIRQPQNLHGYIFHDAYTMPNSQTLIIGYVWAGENPLARGLSLYQSTDESMNYQIGENAIVQAIEINGVYGEYVQGNWETIETTTSATQLSVRSQWDNTVQLHMLVWEIEGVTYQLLWQAAYLPHPAYYDDGAPNEAGYLSLEDLIAIAASLQ